MSELKRCPFCGGEAEFYRTPIKTNGCWCDSVVVRCKVCEARTNRVLYDAKKHLNDEEYEEAAEAWNTRKPMQNIVERLEEENTLLKEQRTEAIEYDDEQIIFAANNQIRAFDYSLRVIKEEGGLNEN